MPTARRSSGRPPPSATSPATMLLVVNPRASSFSQATEEGVVRTLETAFELETARTESPEHALSLSRDAARGGSHAVVAVLGGDGAVNEAANGLAGTSTPLGPLPGGRTNVFCRILGVPNDPLRAAAELCALACARGGDGHPVHGYAPLPTRRVDLGTMNGRHFTFASGVGVTAVANHRLNVRGVPGQRLGGLVFALEALGIGAAYLRRPRRIEVESDGRSLACVSLVVQNADPLTYLGRRPLPLCERAGLETGTVSLALLRRLTVRESLLLAGRVVSGRGPQALAGEALASLPAVPAARVRTLDGHPLPVEVDGDYVGEVDSIEYGVLPRGLSVVAPAGAGSGE